MLGINKTNCKTVVNNSFKAFSESDYAVVASGTATLECAITNTPFVVIYKTSFISWLLTSFFIKVQYASIVNILANKRLFPECLQKNCTAAFITKQLIKLINKDLKKTQEELNAVIQSLGDGESYNKTAKFLLRN